MIFPLCFSVLDAKGLYARIAERSGTTVCPVASVVVGGSADTFSELTCDEYQALPEGERNPEDLVFTELAKKEKWRQCPKVCSQIAPQIAPAYN